MKNSHFWQCHSLPFPRRFPLIVQGNCFPYFGFYSFFNFRHNSGGDAVQGPRQDTVERSMRYEFRESAVRSVKTEVYLKPFSKFASPCMFFSLSIEQMSLTLSSRHRKSRRRTNRNARDCRCLAGALYLGGKMDQIFFPDGRRLFFNYLVNKNG